MTSSITTPLHTTGRYYGESPGMRLVRLALGTAQRLWPALAGKWNRRRPALSRGRHGHSRPLPLSCWRPLSRITWWRRRRGRRRGAIRRRLFPKVAVPHELGPPLLPRSRRGWGSARL